MPFSATAAGKVSDGTCSLTEDCQAGPISAMPVPTMKQNTKRIFGVTILNQASTVSAGMRSEEHTSELQSRSDLVCRLLLEKKKNTPSQLSSTRRTPTR